MRRLNGMTLHTFELSLPLTAEEAQRCRDRLYTMAERLQARCFEQDAWLNFYGFQRAGVKISLRPNVNIPGALIRLRVNPSVLCGSKDPTALFLPQRRAMADLTGFLDALTCAFLEARTIYDFTLNRLDLCRDICLETQAILMEYLRLLKKGADRSRWSAECFGDERDAHSFRRACAAYEVTVYDKLYELRQKDRSRYRQPPFQRPGPGCILRMEAALKREGLRRQREALHIDCASTWPDLLVQLSQAGLSILFDLLDQLSADAAYYTLEAARVRIQGADFRRQKKEKLCRFLSEANRRLSLDTSAICGMKNGRKRLGQLSALNINPVTIESRAGLETLPSVQELLRGAAFYFDPAPTMP